MRAAEWAKTKARKDRWEEEYKLIVEEMRRTVVYLEWKADWWKVQASRRKHSVNDRALIQGISAFAHHQVYLVSKLAASCAQTWVPILWQYGIKTPWADKYNITQQDQETSNAHTNDIESYISGDIEDEDYFGRK